MISLLLGAGFSKWATNLPVVDELFDFNIKPWGPQEDKKLKAVKLLKRKWDKANPKKHPEEFIAETMKYHEKSKNAVIWYIVRRFSAPFIWKEFHAGRWRRHVLMIDENRKYDISGILRAKNFLQKLYSPSLRGIITTNYDMIIEYALGTKRFNYGIPGEILSGRGPYPVSQWLNPVTLKGEVPLAKIHGSISWDENNRYTDGRRGIRGNALIVAPMPKKYLPSPLKPVWKLAKCILQHTTHLVVFGFSFNPYDEEILNLLKDAGSNIKSILLIDIDPKIKRACELWPNASITPCQSPSLCDKKIKEWSYLLLN